MMENHEKIILDLCGGSGSWSRPYRLAGYDVRLITLPDYDVRTYQPPDHVYGILAAPPCAEFSLAKNGSRRTRDLAAGMECVEACLQIIWQCQKTEKLQFWALENPVGLLRRFMGRPPYTFYQWWFGDLGIKRTDLWGYFNAPKQQVHKRPDDPYFVKQYKSGKKSVRVERAEMPGMGREIYRATTRQACCAACDNPARICRCVFPSEQISR